ncbi:hypothetical protein PBRA_008723 [Plasmodiophora brassicae]|uniref:ER membrane protein complex subunit 6 n=1 Tax=Plasmodiophora brassicae TaxID=37360 RepID=A0A0G4J3E7_PLABS|nr:hypothetical protein PBRA_008723 [Plasmodiophora brassicae]
MVARYGEVPIENPAAPRTPNVAARRRRPPTPRGPCGIAFGSGGGGDGSVLRARRSVSAAAGCVAGLLGLRGVAGLAFFIAMSLVTSAAIALRVQGRVGRYFRSPWHVVKPGLFQGATTFVLFWTLIFNSIYIY